MSSKEIAVSTPLNPEAHREGLLIAGVNHGHRALAMGSICLLGIDSPQVSLLDVHEKLKASGYAQNYRACPTALLQLLQSSPDILFEGRIIDTEEPVSLTADGFEATGLGGYLITQLELPAKVKLNTLTGWYMDAPAQRILAGPAARLAIYRSLSNARPKQRRDIHEQIVELGCSIDTLDSHLKVLLKAGLVSVVDSNRKPNKYRLNPDHSRLITAYTQLVDEYFSDRRMIVGGIEKMNALIVSGETDLSLSLLSKRSIREKGKPVLEEINKAIKDLFMNLEPGTELTTAELSSMLEIKSRTAPATFERILNMNGSSALRKRKVTRGKSTRSLWSSSTYGQLKDENDYMNS